MDKTLNLFEKDLLWYRCKVAQCFHCFSKTTENKPLSQSSRVPKYSSCRTAFQKLMCKLKGTFSILDLFPLCSFVLTNEPVAAVLSAPEYKIHSHPVVSCVPVDAADYPLLRLFDNGIVFHHFGIVLLEHLGQNFWGNAVSQKKNIFSFWGFFCRL